MIGSNEGPSKRQIDNQELDANISLVYHEHEGRYGHRRIYVETFGARYIFWVARANTATYAALEAQGKSIIKITTDSDHNEPVAPN